ncbi:unnamed protein product, partial [Allacma fusca]
MFVVRGIRIAEERNFMSFPTRDLIDFYIDNCGHERERSGGSFEKCVPSAVKVNPMTSNMELGQGIKIWKRKTHDKTPLKTPLKHIPLQECLGKGNFSCTDNGAYPHEELCEYYYDCWEGQATLCRCTDELLFDLVYDGCNYPEQVDCGDRVRPGTGPTPPPKASTQPGTGPTQPGGDFVCPKDEGLFPNPKDCSTYYQCNG